MSTGVDEVGDGILSRLSAAVYRYLALQLYLVITCGPTVLVWTLLAAEPGNLIIFVAALLPIAPALSGALYGIRAWSRSPDLAPFRPLWRGLAGNLGDVLPWWLPVLAVTAVLAINVVFAGSVPGGELLRPICLALLLPLAVWSAHLLVITASFSFRTRDALRIAAAEVFTQWRSSLGIIGLMIMAAVVVVIGSEAVLLLLGWAFAGLLRLLARPVEAEVTVRFTR